MRLVQLKQMQKGGTVYIMTNVLKSVLYTGVTADLIRRVQEHKNKVYPYSFTARYNVVHLVYYQSFPSIEEAIAEEKRIKAGNRKQKCRLISSVNPEWKDLWDAEVSTW
jgi:putative endonuclease